MNLVRGLLRKSLNPAAVPTPDSPSIRDGGFPGADLDDATAPRIIFRYYIPLDPRPTRPSPGPIGTCNSFA